MAQMKKEEKMAHWCQNSLKPSTLKPQTQTPHSQA